MVRKRAGDQTNADGAQTFGEILRWMVGSRHISDYITLDRDSPRPVAKSGEVCVLAPSDTSPGVLRDICGVIVVTAYCDGNCDVPWGSAISEGLRAVVAVSQAVVVVEHSADIDNWPWLFSVLEKLMTLRRSESVSWPMNNTRTAVAQSNVTSSAGIVLPFSKTMSNLPIRYLKPCSRNIAAN